MANLAVAGSGVAPADLHRLIDFLAERGVLDEICVIAPSVYPHRKTRVAFHKLDALKKALAGTGATLRSKLVGSNKEYTTEFDGFVFSATAYLPSGPASEAVEDVL